MSSIPHAPLPYSYGFFRGKPPTDFYPAPDATITGPPQVDINNAKNFGFTGDECTACHQFMMVHNGTCLKCTACGETTGCS